MTDTEWDWQVVWHGLPVPTKNSRDIIYSKKANRMVTVPSVRAKSWLNSVIRHLLGQGRRQAPAKADFADWELECLLELYVVTMETRVFLRKLWPKAKKGKTGRNADVDNLLCSVFDALQRGGVIDNDSQIGIARVVRVTNQYLANRDDHHHGQSDSIGPRSEPSLPGAADPF